MIEIDGLSVRFPARGIDALRDVSVHVSAGERVAVVGPSGSGKTTLLRALLAAVRPTAGTVRVAGWEPNRSTQEARSVRRATGTVRQGGDLVRGLTARTNIAIGAFSEWRAADWFGLLLARAPVPLADRITALADRHGIADCLDARVESLSGGQRQRVAICRALLGRPVVLLADEPTTGLDPVTSRAVLDGLEADPSVTLVVASHDPAVIARFDRMVALRDGRVVHDGAPLPEADLVGIYGPTWSDTR